MSAHNAYANPVYTTIDFFQRRPEQFVKINRERLEEVAQKVAKDDFPDSEGSEPVYVAPYQGDVSNMIEQWTAEHYNRKVVDAFCLAGSLDFCFKDPVTKQYYATVYEGTQWVGSFGMWAALKRGLYNGYLGLDGKFDAEFLSRLPTGNGIVVFEGSMQDTPPSGEGITNRIPLLQERMNILREVGHVLHTKYGGSFANLVDESDHRLYNDGNGFVERLTRDFPSFDDSIVLDGKRLRFDKRAQLTAGLLLGQLGNHDPFRMRDAHELTVFADYILPRNLRSLGIFEYDPILEGMVERQEPILANGSIDTEMRARTLIACNGPDGLIERINHHRRPLGKIPIGSLELDSWLWNMGRAIPKTSPLARHILCATTAY